MRYSPVLLVSVLWACGESSESQEVVHSADLFASAPLWQLDEAGGRPFEYIADGTFSNDGNVLLVDGAARQVIGLDSSGGFMFRVGREGGGPGEFDSRPLGITSMPNDGTIRRSSNRGVIRCTSMMRRMSSGRSSRWETSRFRSHVQNGKLRLRSWQESCPAPMAKEVHHEWNG